MLIRLLLALALLSIMLLPACGGPRKFETASLSTQEQVKANASSIWKKEGWGFTLPKDARKIAITEFAVEYVIGSGEQAHGIGLMPALGWVGVGKKKMQYDETMKQELPGELYPMFVAALEKEGFTVVPADTLVNTSGYKELTGLKAGEETKASQNTGFAYRRTEYVKGEVYSAPPLKAVDTGFFANFGNPQKEMRAVGESGADTRLRVRIRIGIDEEGRAMLWAGSVVHIAAGVAEVKGSKNPVQYFNNMNAAMTSKESLYFAEPVISKKEFAAFQGDVYTIQPGPFKSAVKGVFPQFSAAAASTIRN